MSTRPRTLVFFQHNPWPPRTGAHQRCLALLRALQNYGSETVLFGSNLHTDTQWQEAGMRELSAQYGVRIERYQGNPADIRYCANIRWDAIQPAQWGHFAPPGLKQAFVNFARRFKPDVVIVIYSFFGGLVDDPVFNNTFKIMETLDLYSLSVQLQGLLQAHYPPAPIDPNQAPLFLLQDDFLASFGLDAWREEYQMCDLYDHSIMVSPSDLAAVQAHTRRTTVSRIPITAEPVELDNTYRGAPLYLAALNMVNVQGYLFFARRVLPLLKTGYPDFALDVAGSCCKQVQPVPGIQLRGYVSSMSELYRDCAFAICPLLGATGQQIKVVEAMSYGIPVVVHKNVADSSPVIHGRNGFVARNAEEFAEYCGRLYADRALCARLGAAARQTIKKNWSQKVFDNKLAALLDSRRMAHRRQTVARTKRAPAPIFSILLQNGEPRSEAELRTMDSLQQQEGIPFEVFVIGGSKLNVQLPATASWQQATSVAGALRRARGQFAVVVAAGDCFQPWALRCVWDAARRFPAVTHWQGIPALYNAAGQLIWIMGDAEFKKHQLLTWLYPQKEFFKLPAAREPRRLGKIPALLVAGAASGGRPQGVPPPVTKGQPVRWALPCEAARAHLVNIRKNIDRRDLWAYLERIKASWFKEQQLYFKRLVQCRWESFRYMAGRQTRVALFGAGVHTHWLLQTVRKCNGPEVVAILDDFAKASIRIAGIPIERAATFDPGRVDAIVLSTDAREAEFEARCQALYGNKVKRWRLYEGLPPGPYQKS